MCCLGHHHPDQLGQAEEAHVVHDARPPPNRPEQSKLGPDLPRVDDVMEKTREEVKGNIRWVGWSAYIVLLLLIPDKKRSQPKTNTCLYFVQNCMQHIEKFQRQKKLTLDEEVQGPLGQQCCSQAEEGETSGR